MWLRTKGQLMSDSTKQQRTSREWLNLSDEFIMDIDGWRTNVINGEQFAPCNFEETLISEYEFNTRLMLCTRKLSVKSD